MSTSQNMEIVRRAFNELFGDGNLDVVEELYASDFVDNGEVVGQEGMKEVAAMFLNAFPDLTFTLDDQFAQGNKVVTRWTVTATHQGAFMEIPATGNGVELAGISIHTVVNGRITEHRGQTDMLGLLQQIGAVPAPDAA